MRKLKVFFFVSVEPYYGTVAFGAGEGKFVRILNKL